MGNARAETFTGLRKLSDRAQPTTHEWPPKYESGAPGGTRTHDLQVRNLTLYPLSYGRA